MGNKITFNGKEYWWTGSEESVDKLMYASGFIGDSLPATELSVDTLSAVVRDYDLQPRVLAAEGLPLMAGGTLLIAQRTHTRLDLAAKYGDDVLYHHNDKLVGKFRLQHAKRTGRYQFDLTCVSDMGLLLTSDHYGGIYTGQTAAAVIAEIIGGIIPYTLDTTLGAVPVYGLLRRRSRRDNLRDVLFAIGGQVRKDSAGTVNIVPMTAGTPYRIPVDRFYMGGSVTGGNPATGVNVTEHSFMALDSDDVITLFDGVAAGDEIITPQGKTVIGVQVDFQEPMHDLEIQNSTILEQGANYAVISNSAEAVLTGKQYTHTTRIISRRSNHAGIPNEANSHTCELVNFLNSELVADRLMAYYSSAKTVEAKIVVDGQKPGDAVTFVDPFGDETSGYIGSMELSMSAILKASTTLISGYVPTASGNYYSNMLIIQTSQTVTIPEEAKGKGLLVLIGGGDGGGLGNAGEAGEAGQSGTVTASVKGGAGGLPGTPGVGGKIFVATIPLTRGEQVSVRIGSGGIGQTLTSGATRGGDTTFGRYSSADGSLSVDGYINIINGDIYGIPGKEGLAGGRGGGSDGEGGYTEYLGVVYEPGAKGKSGAYGSYAGLGGFGGGSAAGANGYPGESGSADGNAGSPFASGGDGGRGATPVKAENGKVPGQGGGAGHGSGGGGAGGSAKGSGSDYQRAGSGGAPGDPGEGGNGAAGLAVLYY